MSVPTSYLPSTKNTADVLAAMQKASVPPKFTYEFLKQLGYPSSNDRPMLAMLKALGFLDDSGSPTERYRRFKDGSESKFVLAEGVREAYSDVFALDQNANNLPGSDLKGMFARVTGKGEAVTQKMATTFKAFCDWADFSGASEPKQEEVKDEVRDGDAARKEQRVDDDMQNDGGGRILMRHDVHVHLPVTTEIAVYDAIFKSLRENLL
jgi:hypothetical protein